MKFLANENYPYPSIRLLRELNYDVKSIGEEQYGISDAEVLDIAKNENRIILTLDKDYGELIFRLKAINPPAVVFYRYKGQDTEFAGRVLVEIIEQSKLKLDNAFTVIEHNNLRQRIYS